MLFRLTDGDPRPLADQLAASVRRAVATGEAPAGTRLPSGRDVAEALGVSLQTVQRAYQLLAAEGVVVSRVGRGTTIADDVDPDRLSLTDHVERLVASARAIGMGDDELVDLVRHALSG